jgi:hypothetical protein
VQRVGPSEPPGKGEALNRPKLLRSKEVLQL